MKLIAKGMLPEGYWAFGRKWPRLEAIEVTVSDDEAQAILADPNIVALVCPAIEAKKAQQSGKAQ